MVAIAPGMFLAQSVVPSSGSTAMSTFGPRRLPTVSPMNSMGASSRSPSPITIVTSLGSMLVARRLVGGLRVAAAGHARRRDRRALGHPHDLERECAVERHVRLDGGRRRRPASLFAHGPLLRTVLVVQRYYASGRPGATMIA